MSSDFLKDMAQSSRERVRRARAKTGDLAMQALAQAAPSAPALKLSNLGFDLIAEVKLRSPAVGKLEQGLEDIGARASDYASAGAAAISVLTEPTRFDGELSHLEQATRELRVNLAHVRRGPELLRRRGGEGSPLFVDPPGGVAQRPGARPQPVHQLGERQRQVAPHLQVRAGGPREHERELARQRAGAEVDPLVERGAVAAAPRRAVRAEQVGRVLDAGFELARAGAEDGDAERRARRRHRLPTRERPEQPVHVVRAEDA